MITSLPATLSPTDAEQLQILHQIQHHAMTNTQAFLFYTSFLFPGPISWKLAIYNFLLTLPIPPLTPMQITLLVVVGPTASIIILILFITILLWGIKRFVPFILGFISPKPEEHILLQLTFPADTTKSSYATQQLYILLHSLARQKTFFEQVTHGKKTYALEIVATKKEGIRYILSVEKNQADIIKRSLLSYLPGIKITEVSDYLSPESNENNIVHSISELKLSGKFMLPLQKQDILSHHDLMSYITGSMTQLKNNELIAFQLVTTPVMKETHSSILSEITTLKHKMYKQEPIAPLLQTSPLDTFLSLPGISFLWLMIKLGVIVIKYILLFVISIIPAVMDTSGKSVPILMTSDIKIPSEILNPYEQELSTAVKGKIDQQLFEASIRVLIQAENMEEADLRLSGLLASFGPLSTSYQSVTTKGSLFGFPSPKKRLREFTERRISQSTHGNPNPILSASEMSDLYHFPYTTTTQTEDLVKTLSRELPAPLSLKRSATLDVVFAKNTYGGEETPIGLSLDDRRRHVALFGQTGSGKSTLMLSMIDQDIANGKGLCVIDPHGQLAETVLSRIVAANRQEDLIWFNPDDLEHVLAINLMELTPGLSKYDALREKEFICESIISLFRKVFSDSFDNNPHRIESILRNTIHTAFTVEGATLFTIYDLLTDPNFRGKVVGKLTDERLQKFWKQLFGKAGSWQQVKMIAPVTSRIERFLFSPSTKEILDNTRSTINFDEIMDHGKILVCNVSKGKLGEDTSQVLGMLILTKIQLTALKRARKSEEQRRDFYLYVDEFQNFATLSFVQMLSEARKYHLNLILAEQSTAQQKDKQITNILFANTGTIITFKTASPQDEAIILPQFEPYVTKGEVHNLPAYHFYIKLGAMNPEEPFSGITVPLEITGNTQEVSDLIALSNKHYTVSEHEKGQKAPSSEKQPQIIAQPKQGKTVAKRKIKTKEPDKQMTLKNVSAR